MTSENGREEHSSTLRMRLKNSNTRLIQLTRAGKSLFRFSFGERVALSFFILALLILMVFGYFTVESSTQNQLDTVKNQCDNLVAEKYQEFHLGMMLAGNTIHCLERERELSEKTIELISCTLPYFAGIQEDLSGKRSYYFVDPSLEGSGWLEEGSFYHPASGNSFIVARLEKTGRIRNYIFNLTFICKQITAKLPENMIARISMGGKYVYHENPLKINAKVGHFFEIGRFFKRSVFLPLESFVLNDPVFAVRNGRALPNYSTVPVRVYIGAVSGMVYKQILQERAFISNIILISYGVLLLLSLVMARLITTPLRKVAKFVRKLNESNIKDIDEVNYVFKDEVWELYESICKMASDLDTTFSQLEKHQASLEEIIQKRTSQLKVAMARIEETNRDLQSVVAKQSQQLIASEKRALLATLVHGLTHNLKSPLANVMGYLYLLRSEVKILAEKPENSEFLGWVEIMIDSCQKMDGIISSMLQRAVNRESDKKVEIDVNNLIKREIVFLESDLFFKHHIQKNLHLSNSLPSIFGSYSDLSQVIENLLQNAREAMHDSPKKQLTIETTTDNGNVIVKIADTGEGIKEEDLDKIFEAYFSTKREKSTLGGTGLGLAMCRQTLEVFKGTIKAESEAGKGATFVLTIPVASVEEPEQTKEPETPQDPVE